MSVAALYRQRRESKLVKFSSWPARCEVCQRFALCESHYGSISVDGHRRGSQTWICRTCLERLTPTPQHERTKMFHVGQAVQRSALCRAVRISYISDYGRVVGFSRDGRSLRVVRDGTVTPHNYCPSYWEPRS